MYDFLWKQHAVPHFALPTLNNQTIVNTEKKLGIRLPKSFISLNQIQNGGELSIQNYSLTYADQEVFIEELLGIDPELGIGQSLFLQQQWAIPKDLIIISGEEEDWLALDYRKSYNLEPRIVWYDASSSKIRIIAKSFEQFLENLIDSPFEYNDDFE